MTENKELTPKRAFEKFNDEGMTNSQIAEEFDVSESTVVRRRKTFREQKEVIEDIAENKLQSYNPEDSVSDDEPEDNPYTKIECPNCGTDFDPPDEPGEMDCPGCNVGLNIEQSDLQ